MTNLIDVRFPDDQSEGTEATIAQWLVKPGDSVAAHDPIVEIETDKVVVEIAAPEAGRIADIKIPNDAEVNPGDLLCEIDISEDPHAAGPDTTIDQDSTGKQAAGQSQTTSIELNHGNGESHPTVQQSGLSPAVRQRVMQHDLDISGLKGSGRNGRITLADVEKLIAAPQKSSSGVGSDQKTPRVDQASPVSQPFSASVKGVGSDILPHSKMRKRIAENMVASLMHSAPHVTAVFEADLSAIMRHRAAHKSQYADRGTPLTLTVYFVAAAIAALQKVPQVNSRWHDDHLEVFHAINIGIGTALGDQGLIVPVLHHAETMNLKGIAKALNDVTERARSNQLKPEDVRGGTFTISNHGVSGSLIATPIIINQPQSAILGVGKIEKRVKVTEIDGQDAITIRPMSYISLTIDHRVIDGHQTNAFLTELVNTLENWS